MHEHNDEALYRPAHGRAPYGTYHSVVGLDRYSSELKTPVGKVSVRFEGRDGLRVTIRHPDPFFRAVEKAWNHQSDLGERDVHARFWGLTEAEVSGSFDFKQRVDLVSSFLTLAASALDALANGQRAEIASLEEHARQLRVNPASSTQSPYIMSPREVL